MNLFGKIIFGLAIPIALVCIVLTFVGDYSEKSRLFSSVRIGSFTVVSLGLMFWADSKRKKSGPK
jgi:hypothetical protein